MTSKISNQDVAQWMVEELERVTFLYQNVIVYTIRSRFGEEFTYINPNGNLAINKKVLSAFGKLTGDTVVWERGQRYWRKRKDYDSKGRLQR